MTLFKIKELVYFAFFTALIAVSAFLSFPIGSVPFTMQTFTLYLCALILGSKKASLAVLFYLFLGLIGFPFFSGAKSGLAAFLSPTGGFLLAFAPTVFIAGMAKGKNLIQTCFFLVLSLVFLYTCGTLWLKEILDISLQKAFTFAAAPFIIPDMIKIALAYFLYSALLKQGNFEFLKQNS